MQLCNSEPCVFLSFPKKADTFLKKADTAKLLRF